MIHPDDPTLVITPTVKREHSDIWLNKLITNLTLFASISAWCAALTIVIALSIRVAVGETAFKLGSVYLLYAGGYLALVVICMLVYSMTMRLPAYAPRWSIQKEPEWEDPYDEMDYKHFGR